MIIDIDHDIAKCINKSSRYNEDPSDFHPNRIFESNET